MSFSNQTNLLSRLLVIMMIAISLFIVAGPITSIANASDSEHGEHIDAHDGHGEVTLSAIFSDKKFLGSMINFLLMMGIIVYFGGKKINAALLARRDQLASEIAEARKLKQEAEAKHAEYSRRLKDLDKEIESMKVEMKRAAESERDSIIAEAKRKADRMREDTKFVIEQQSKQLRADLTKEAVEAAITSATGLLKAETKAVDHERMAKSFLTQISQQRLSLLPERK